MRLQNIGIGTFAAAAITLLGTTAFAQGNYLYVGDYTGNEVIRFDGSKGDNSGATAPVKYIDTSALGWKPEGMGGVKNILAVAGSDSNIHYYDVSGSTALARGTTNIAGYGLRINFNTAGTTEYVASGGGLQAFSFSQSGSANVNTSLLATLTASSLGIAGLGADGIWGVAVSPVDNSVYFTTGWNTSGKASVWKANANLTGATKIVNVGDNGVTALAGIAFKKDGSFYAVNGSNGDPTNPFINHYSASGAFLDKVNLTGLAAGSLNNAFDAEVGPDGFLYVSSQSGACVVKINANTDIYDSVFVHPNGGGIQSAKTIHFNLNNPGAPGATPEPGAFAFAGIFAAGVAGMVIRKRKA